MQMGSKRRLKTPGPGAYNASTRPITPCPPAFTMGAKWGDLTAGLDWEPGPGFYAASAHRTRCRDGPCITIAPRTQSGSSSSAAPAGLALSKCDTPGPGSYNSDRCRSLTGWRHPAYSIAGRTNSFHMDISPGPGAYSVAAEPSGPAFSMPLGRKTPPGAPSLTPGPGFYSATELLQRPRTPVISIAGPGREGSRAQLCMSAASPGPGAYNPARSPRGRAFTISTRKPARPIEESPGPGQYCAEASDAVTHPREPARSIAVRTRDGSSIASAALTPGPGAYDPQKWNPGSSTAITILGRPTTRRRPLPADITPGPGAYFLSSTPSCYSSPSVKIAGKNHRPPPTPVPGPGAYSPRVEHDAHAITISSKKPNLSSHGVGPGPANYFWDNKYYTKFTSPAVSMGVRFTSKASELGPGPGYYNVPSIKSGPSFSMHSGSERYSFA